MITATHRQWNWTPADSSWTTPTLTITASAALMGRSHVAVRPFLLHSRRSPASLRKEQGCVTLTLLQQEGTVQVLAGVLVVRKKAPHAGIGMSILYIAHNLKFMKIYGMAGYREAYLVFRGLSTFLGSLQ